MAGQVNFYLKWSKTQEADFILTEPTIFFQMRDNLGVTLDNQSSPSPPEFIPPQRIFAGWLFEVNTSVSYLQTIHVS